MSDNAIFQYLSDTHGRYRASAKGLPAEVKVTPTRKVIGFTVMGISHIVPLEEVSEILDVPHVTRLPRVKSWVRGVANVRGRLLPIINIAEFLGGKLSSTLKDRRVIVFEVNDVYVGVVVDSVQGLQKIPVDRYRRELNAQSPLRKYLEGHYHQLGKELPLFRPHKLISDDVFMDVSA